MIPDNEESIMASSKEEARKLIDRMPDHVTWDDIMYEIYVRTKIDLGLDAAAEGRVIPHEEVKRLFIREP